MHALMTDKPKHSLRAHTSVHTQCIHGLLNSASYPTFTILHIHGVCHFCTTLTFDLKFFELFFQFFNLRSVQIEMWTKNRKKNEKEQEM